MYLPILIKIAAKNFKRSYLLFSLFNLLLLSSTLFMASCKEEINSPESKPSLSMYISPIKRMEKQATIETIFSLNGNINSVTLHQYQLRVTLSDKESSLMWDRTKKVKENIANSIKSLTFFTKQSTLTIQDEALTIPFTLILSSACEQAHVFFELLDEYGNCIQSCAVSCMNIKNNSEQLNVCLDNVPEKSEAEPRYVGMARKIASAVTNLDALEKEPSYLRSDTEEKQLSPSQEKTRTKRVKREQPQNNLAIPNTNYNQIDINQLAHLANSNNSRAQEEILDRFLKTGLTPLLEKLVNPFKWQGIKEKAREDQRYMYLLLHFSEQVEDPALYKEFKEYVEVCIKGGHVLAQINLGYMYEAGLGVEQDDKKAVEWYRKAAGQHHPIAQYHLAEMFYDGKGVLFDPQEATKWYKAAAEQGYALAQANLGHMYREGLQEKLDKLEAVKWYKAAAHQGCVTAQYRLGLMYKEGEGVKQKSYMKAIKWLEVAASQGYVNAQVELGAIYKDCLIDESHITKAIEWYKKAATQRSKRAQNALGTLYLEGISGQVNLPEAIFWFRQAENREALLEIFKIKDSLLPIPTPGSRERQALENIEILGHNLLHAWQEAFMQKEYTRKYNHITLHKEFYKKLEHIITTVIIWKFKLRPKLLTEPEIELKTELHKQPGLMIDYALFKAPHKHTVENCQQQIDAIPYVKQHTFGHHTYLSIGKENVQLAQEIIHELTHKSLYKELKTIIKRLESDYKQSRIAATGQVRFATAHAYIEEKLNMYLEDEGKLKNSVPLEQKEIAELQQYLNRINQNQELDSTSVKDEPLYICDFDDRLEKLFDSKLEKLREEKDQFKKYYNSFIEEVKRGLPYRNKHFKSENLYLF
jgi:TPR repeat protein